jgi:hypothetical protein
VTEFWKRFWLKVDWTPTCWLWRGAKREGGYGSMLRNGKLQSVHRLAYDRLIGPIPEGLRVLHTCDIPGCVNPRHLFLGTQRDNMRDGVRKGRVRVPGTSGAKNPMAKLTEAQVAEIRASFERGHGKGFPRGNAKALARKFGIDPNHVRQIVRGRRWQLAEATL